MPSQVLIVDDDPMLQRLLCSHLNTAGYQPLQAYSGKEGLEMLRASGPRIAFVDYDMPGINGVEFCRCVREDASIPFAHLVILTAHVDRALTIAALDSGANDFMTKPFHRGELLARLRAGERAVHLYEEAARAAGLQVELNHLRHAVNEMETMLCTVTNQMQSPVASLRSMSQSFGTLPAGVEWEKSLTQINDGILRISGTVGQLLDATRQNGESNSWQWSRFGVQGLCQEVIQETSLQLRQRPVTIQGQVQPVDMEMHGDRTAIRHLLGHLLSSACDRTESGNVTLSAQVKSYDSHQWLDLSIIDNGRKTASAEPMEGDLSVNSVWRRILDAHCGKLHASQPTDQGNRLSLILRTDLEQVHQPAAA